MKSVSSSKPQGMRRRTWLLGALGATGALVLGWSAMPPRQRLGDGSEWSAGEPGVALNGWIKIRPDSHVVLAMPRSEMGQGVHSALAQLVAEELDVPLEHVHLEQASGESLYGNVSMFVAALPLHPRDKHAEPPPLKVRVSQWMVAKIARELGINATGGSSTIADAWHPLRLAAASARAMLVQAAAQRWQLASDTLAVNDGVVSAPGGQRATWGELVSAAVGVKPANVLLKSPETFRLIGKPLPRADIPQVVFAQSTFGLDVRLPDMRFASVRMAPTLGGGLDSLDATDALKMPGVERVLNLPALDGSSAGFVVVARSWWQADQAAAVVKPQWSAGEHLPDSTAIAIALREAAQGEEGFVFHERGDADAAWASDLPAERRLESIYEAPYLAHATLEPMNATAWVRDGRVQVWAPTQVPQLAQAAAARAAGVGSDEVDIHVTRLGGGFGRRLEVDVVAQAAAIAQQMAGTPVQLIWSRQQDFAHDFYRPAMAARLRATLDEQGLAQSLHIQSAGDAITPRWLARVLPALAGPFDTPDKTAAEGLFDLSYNIPHQRMAHQATRSHVPIGFWRSVGHSHNAFASECFMDELAHLAGKDPLQYRMDLLQDQPRYRRVLEALRLHATWDAPLPEGHARGIALHESFGSVVGMAVYVEKTVEADIRISRAVSVIDCGTVVNPNTVAAQMEGSVVFALTAALYGDVTIRAGAVQIDNFPSQPLMDLKAAPIVRTHVLASTDAPTGVGEPGVPPAAPALANALYALTGKRQRKLPLQWK